ncbi:hypothetical protein A9K97_gp070 [Tokyovirus A1]|uniref:hypothetical protein n=1 Tax=Tokyovirus A1 TaxID=1826170 RepID=UPI0007A975F6|nr:hypothetical protein A9K97_gp070 [Tokyovirus A1]BAU80281.1 conserved hypothetical protein [Tokyovirus A1]
MSSYSEFRPLTDTNMLNWILLLFIVGMIVWLVFFRKPSAVHIEHKEGYDGQEEFVLTELKKAMLLPDKSHLEMTEAEFQDAANNKRIQMAAVSDAGVESVDGKKREKYSFYFPVGTSGYPLNLYSSLYDYTPRSLSFAGWRFLKTDSPVWLPGRWRLFNGKWWFVMP